MQYIKEIYKNTKFVIKTFRLFYCLFDFHIEMASSAEYEDLTFSLFSIIIDFYSTVRFGQFESFLLDIGASVEEINCYHDIYNIYIESIEDVVSNGIDKVCW